MRDDGTSDTYQCNLTNGVGYIDVPLPTAYVNALTKLGTNNSASGHSRKDIVPIQVVGP